MIPQHGADRSVLTYVSVHRYVSSVLLLRHHLAQAYLVMFAASHPHLLLPAFHAARLVRSLLLNGLLVAVAALHTVLTYSKRILLHIVKATNYGSLYFLKEIVETVHYRK
jgi:hypothetical protein